MIPIEALLAEPVVDADAARAYLTRLFELGFDYHPEDPAAEIIVGMTGEALFTPAQAVLADARMAEVAALLEDPCQVLLDLCIDPSVVL